MLLVISAGGMIGALARDGLSQALPHHPGQWPWSVLLINVSGGAGIGLLMGWLAVARSPSRYLRPFLGVGVLGGYTTLSASSLDGFQLIQAHRPGVAVLYLMLTAAGALTATAGALLVMVAWRPGGFPDPGEPELGP
jgi:CrcB protein